MKVLTLKRIYTEVSTLGILSIDGKLICYTIELPARNNARGVSCIPEGRYVAKFEFHATHGQVYRLDDVPKRAGILIHIANRTSELKGCIAPNMTIRTATEGAGSKEALMSILLHTGRETIILEIQ